MQLKVGQHPEEVGESTVVPEDYDAPRPALSLVKLRVVFRMEVVDNAVSIGPLLKVDIAVLPHRAASIAGSEGRQHQLDNFEVAELGCGYWKPSFQEQLDVRGS